MTTLVAHHGYSLPKNEERGHLALLPGLHRVAHPELRGARRRADVRRDLQRVLGQAASACGEWKADRLLNAVGGYRLEFKNHPIAGEIEHIQRLRVVYSPLEREFIEASEANDFVLETRRNNFFPHPVENVKIELIRTAAYLAFLPQRPVAPNKFYVARSRHPA
jgi:hypothetical protein